MNQKQSKKHHYLPRKYLRGFVNDRGSFYVYDKKADNIFESSPDSTFFENKLNTVTLHDGSSSDFIERLYADLEGQSWDSLDVIRSTDYRSSINLQVKMNLFLFISFLHWRLPANIAQAEELSRRFFGNDKKYYYLKLMKSDAGVASEEIIEQIRSSPAWKKAARTAIPFAPFFHGSSWAHDVAAWKFLYTGDNESWYIVGDNPIITSGENDHDPLTCLKKFIFPVSGNILLISYRAEIEEIIEPGFAVEYGAAILERSKRFAACHRKDFLESLVKFYKMHVSFGKTSIIIPELFRALGTERYEEGT